jgi:thiamine transporter ThiT
MDLKYSDIIMPDKLKEKLEMEGILYEHIIRVIESAEKFDNKIITAVKDRFIGHLRIGTVTFWVEYAPCGNNYLIHNSYCHRIQIEEGS